MSTATGSFPVRQPGHCSTAIAARTPALPHSGSKHRHFFVLSLLTAVLLNSINPGPRLQAWHSCRPSSFGCFLLPEQPSHTHDRVLYIPDNEFFNDLHLLPIAIFKLCRGSRATLRCQPHRRGSLSSHPRPLSHFSHTDNLNHAESHLLSLNLLQVHGQDGALLVPTFSILGNGRSRHPRSGHFPFLTRQLP